MAASRTSLRELQARIAFISSGDNAMNADSEAEMKADTTMSSAAKMSATMTSALGVITVEPVNTEASRPK